MAKKLYVISGITEQLAQRWEKYFREDLRIYIKKGEVLADVNLTLLEAFVMKHQMKKYNRKNLCNLNLKRVKGKRYRV